MNATTQSGDGRTSLPPGHYRFSRLLCSRPGRGAAAAGQKAELTPRQANIAQGMYEELGPDGCRAHTVAEIGPEFSVSRATIYRHLQREAG
jgi:DNA invertase Pin-like site-specific DNA recombinase